MSRYIDADALLKCAVKPNNRFEFREDVIPVSEVDAAPTADVAPVRRGEWIPNQHWEYRNGNTTISGDSGMGCSACGAVNFTGINQCTPFCPNCGARMKGE